MARSDHAFGSIMTVNGDPPPSAASGAGPKLSLRRLIPLLAIAALSIAAIAMGWHRHLSFETLARHHDTLQDLVAGNYVTALASYVALYIVVIALSLPVGVYLTVIGGILFGATVGGTAALVGATIGAICIFLIARGAFGELLVRRAGAWPQKLADGFRADAFSYLLFLRLVPVFPFWLVNLVPALCGVSLGTFAAATALGIVPATFTFAFVGAGAASVVAAQHRAYQACMAAHQPNCRLEFQLDAAITPELLGAFGALGVLALLPVAVKRWRARSR